MWLCPRGTSGTPDQRLAIDELTRARLIAWYTGQGDRHDEQTGIALVRLARQRRQWIACDCGEEGSRPPLLAPACLSAVRTWYLRRLTGPERPEHRPDCPFFREQRLAAKAEAKIFRKPAGEPEGWFAAIAPTPTHLARRQVQAQTRASSLAPSIPRIGLLLRTLLDRSGQTEMALDLDDRTASVSANMRVMRETAETFQVAPGISLRDVLFTHPKDRGLLIGRLIRAERQWPRGHAPQAFLLIFAKCLEGQEIATPDGPLRLDESLTRQPGDPPGGRSIVAEPSRIRRPTHFVPPGPPYLCFLAWGRPPEGGTIRPLRAWAEPILSGRHFFPIRSEGERQLLRALLAIGQGLARRGIHARVERSLFGDEMCENEEPVLDIRILHMDGRPELCLRVGAQDGIRARFWSHRPDLDLSDEAHDLDRLRRHLWGRILHETERMDPAGRAERKGGSWGAAERRPDRQETDHDQLQGRQ